MLYLVVYDIGDNRRRSKMIHYLEKCGLRRIQRSAFIGSIVKARAHDIARYSQSLIDTEKDVVHIIPVERAAWRNSLVIGTSRWSAGRGENYVIQA